MLLEKLCNEYGVSGDEHRVRSLILDQIRDFADDITIDSMGNVLAFKRGKNSSKRVMLCAHMDEVGFIISGIDDKGYLKFKTVGSIDTRVMISKRVVVGENVNGVIGLKAVHLQSASERDNVPDVSALSIDIGAKSREEAKKRVKIGDYATFDTKYCDLGTDKIKAKAIDDRAGCYILIEALKQDREYEYDTYFCFTVQEEVGLRGATVAAYTINPDIALVIESTTCSDVYKSHEHAFVTTCGGGAAISFMDRASIADRKYIEYLFTLCKQNNIPVQYKRTTMGGNDAGAVHKTRAGVKAASVSVPCRYLHSPAGVASKSDIEAVKDFVNLYLDKIGGIVEWNC